MFRPLWYKLAVWKAIRAAAIEGAGGRCQDCQSREALQVHHVNGYRNKTEFQNGPFRVLCKPCHLSAHSTGRPARVRARVAAMEVSE